MQTDACRPSMPRSLTVSPAPSPGIKLPTPAWAKVPENAVLGGVPPMFGAEGQVMPRASAPSSGELDRA